MALPASDERSLRVLVVDDEPLARTALRRQLERDPESKLVGEAPDGEEAVARIRELRPDLVFLDVQMPGLDGFDVLELLGDEAPAVVFVTAYDAYALRAFEVHALDYLLKPFSDERFASALARAKHLVTQEAAAARRRQAQLTASRRAATARFVVRSAGRVVFLRAEEIDWIEAANYYCCLHVGSSSYLLRESMNELEAALDPAHFVRTHRSAIVRLDRVREIRTLDSELVVLLADGAQVPMSRRRRELLEARFRERT